MQKLSVEFDEGNALTIDNVSVEGTATTGGWHVATKWDPSRVRYSCIGVYLVWYICGRVSSHISFLVPL